MTLRTWVGSCSVAAVVLLAGCQLPGKPAAGPEVPLPSAEMDFPKLYAQNCSGCHGDQGKNGAAIALNNPEYLALVSDETLTSVTANGYKKGLMPGFSAAAGGMLTDAQIHAIVNGMRTAWGKGNVLAGQNAPPYAASKPGDAEHGQQVYVAACARCHGAPGSGAQRGSILNGTYLSLMNPQSLRTIVIIGRPEYGMPGWRNAVPGKPLTDTEVTDVVAFLQSQVPPDPGQPYANRIPAKANTKIPNYMKGAQE